MEKVCSVKEGNQRLQKLRSLTESLPNFERLVKSRKPGYIEMDMEEGHGFGFNLLNQDEISVARWFNSSGTVFQKHAHPEREWIIVYEGSINVVYEDKVKSFGVGEYCYHGPNVLHGATFDEDCWYLAITIPSSEDWPRNNG